MNACFSVPCHNNGTCTNDANGFNCSCLEPWVGQMCESMYPTLGKQNVISRHVEYDLFDRLIIEMRYFMLTSTIYVFSISLFL